MIVINAASLRATNLFKLNPLIQRKRKFTLILLQEECVQCARIYIAGNARCQGCYGAGGQEMFLLFVWPQ
jgi:hypothetical protein